MKNETGIYTGVSREEYERVQRVNWSTLKHMKRSPAHYRAAVQQRAKEDTDALRIGRAVHLAVLEPERFVASIAVWDGDRRAGKEWEKFKEKNGHLEILREADYQQVKAIADAVRSDRHAGPYLQNGSAEVTMLWTHVEPANGVPGFEVECKGRIDFGSNAKVIADLKTAIDGSPDGFGAASWRLDYRAQAAFYVDGYAAANGGELLPYVIIAVEKDEPYVCQVYTVPEEQLEMGRDLYRGHLARLARCRQGNNYGGYGNGPMELPLPRWMQKDDTTGMGLVFEGENANG